MLLLLLRSVGPSSPPDGAAVSWLVRFSVIVSYGAVLSSCGVPRQISEANRAETSGLSVKAHPWHSTGHHRNGGYQNIWEDEERPPALRSAKWLLGRMFSAPNGDPAEAVSLGAIELTPDSGSNRAFWLGHATVLIQLGNQTILTDPIMTQRASPVSFTGPRRLARYAATLEAIPSVDVIVISHDHYDHLDRETIVAARERFDPLFIVPLGVQRHLLKWGITRVIELDWWQYLDFQGIRYHCTPAKHWSQRGLFGRRKTLWSSWYMQDLTSTKSAYFGGDTGYSPHFAEIGDRLGAPDIAVLPIGAYEPRWFMKESHINPSEAVSAFIDLGASHFLGMHWGTFHLSDEPLDEPAEVVPRVAAVSGLGGDRIHVIPIGGKVSF